MKKRKLIFPFLLFVFWVGYRQFVFAQDTRSVTEPTFPASCTVLNAQLAIVSGAPASETTLDTTRIQNALSSCASGEAVELAPSTDGADYAFVMGPITIPTGVGLIVDGGVTVFASRNPADYQISSSSETCGSYGSGGKACSPLITFASKSTGSGLYGYGIIDGRGYATLLKSGVDSGISWWKNADTAKSAGDSQDNPVLISTSSSTNLTFYKITLQNSPMFHVALSSLSGLTIWGIKIITPWSAHNTDGIDPKGTNITISHSSISDGDDDIAVGASSAASNITIDHVTTYSGHGISVGSYTEGGLTNMLVSNVNMAGTALDGNSIGLRLKSAADRGGLLKNVTYENICIRDAKQPIVLNPFYNSNSGTEIPQFSGITYKNVHVLKPTGTKYPYAVTLEGYSSSYPATVTFNNMVFDSLTSSQVTAENLDVTLAGAVYPTLLANLTGTNVSTSGTVDVDNSGSWTCDTASIYPYLTGDLYLSDSASNNAQSLTVASGTSISLNAMLQPAMSQISFSGTAGSYTGASAPTAKVEFYDGTALLGSGTWTGNGTLSVLILSNLSVGTHSITATYPGDTNYSALSFGSVTVIVTGSTSLIATTTTLTAPTTLTAGVSATLQAIVASSSGTPIGNVTFYDGATMLTTAALSSGSASYTYTPSVSNHTLYAVYAGNSTYATSTSASSTMIVSLASTTTTLTEPAALASGSSATLSILVASATGTPTGNVTLYDGTTTLTTAALSSGSASYTYTPSVGTHTLYAVYAGSSVYATSTSANSTLLVSAAQSSLKLSESVATIYSSGSVTFNVVVSGTADGATPTGTITFTNGSSTLGSAVLDASGDASTAYTFSTLGSDTITATYSGDSNYASTSGSVVLNVVAPFMLTDSNSLLDITSTTSGAQTITLTPQGGFAGIVTLSCSSPVSYIQCELVPKNRTVG